MIRCDTVCDRFLNVKIYEEILTRKRKELKLLEKSDQKTVYLMPLRSALPQSSQIGMSRFIFCPKNHKRSLSDLIQRWNRLRMREEKLQLTNKNKNTIKKDSLETTQVWLHLYNLSDVKRFGHFKMHLEIVPLVPTLLRAAQYKDFHLLQNMFEKILYFGISPEILNATDSKGRTALSYICSTKYLNFLEILLKLPKIDFAKSDIEGNAPIHYAAQAGQYENIEMLLTRCHDIKIDEKNLWGLTPIMLAILDGNFKCASLLLFTSTI